MKARGGVSTTFYSSSGSSDPSGAWALGATNFPLSAGAGIAIAVNASGYDDLALSFDQKNSATAPR